jgi:hypothetical protein
MQFKNWLESTYYHGTSPENAKSILKNGIDPNRYKSGMFQGFYLTPNLNYFNNQSKTILTVNVDDNQLLDADKVNDEELFEIDPHFKMMSPMYRYHLIKKLTLSKGLSGVKSGNEIILFNDNAIKSIS